MSHAAPGGPTGTRLPGFKLPGIRRELAGEPTHKPPPALGSVGSATRLRALFPTACDTDPPSRDPPTAAPPCKDFGSSAPKLPPTLLTGFCQYTPRTNSPAACGTSAMGLVIFLYERNVSTAARQPGLCARGWASWGRASGHTRARATHETRSGLLAKPTR